MSLELLIIISLIALLFYIIWRHIGIGQKAMTIAKHHTDKSGVQLLDQSIHLKSIKIKRGRQNLFALQRTYEFEFFTRGDRRYKGQLIFLGENPYKVQMEAFVE